MAKGGISPTQIREMRRRLGVTQTEAALLFDVHFTTYNRWENGHLPPTGMHKKMLEALHNKTVGEIVGMLPKYLPTIVTETPEFQAVVEKLRDQ